MLSDPATPSDVRERLLLVEDTRAFADELGLEVDGQYTSYVAWPGDRVVTTVVATRPGEVEPAGFRFPIVGTLPYKGFFDPARAEAEELRLRGQGLDVCRVGVRAYSTLGWLDDPVTGPMLRLEEGRLVETILHELVHATAFVPSNADFNEGVASFIGQEASVRFYAARDGAAAADARRASVDDDRRVDAALLLFRGAVAELYENGEPGPERDAARAALEEQARTELAALELTTRAPDELARRVRLNDACLALVGTYAADLPDYAFRLHGMDGDVGGFVAALRAAADSDEPREALLEP